ncbi:Succinylglutamate desuccinylase [Serratia marcescens]|uniref:succinylglutamate desuccinylase n=1 Tax=Serratia marcescens TaxID=615 RepID=UPI00217AE9F9|nr:succinylglutamate desuccinylase [Serratia marcescens]CAI0820502.1 Succinylglutamate desuccinylase [Serratia marcescens]CAI0896445.1 Succinylglutamate desuccinylase [Serratia marcescens]CAI1612716.1 Succinylglutamate desuccinylase [Serratia marcescens]CAI1767997.1 Succinylglutamate desuccinylase [Serratia marcescens]
MIDLLPLTLEGNEPVEWQGETSQLRWRWQGEGVLELTPRQPYRQATVMSAGVHGNETAPIELLNQLVGDLLAGRLPLTVRLLVVLGNPAAMRAGKRYLHSDMNRMFGGRYRNFAASGETVRAQQLERALAAFFDGEQAARFHYDLHTAIRESRLPRFGILPFQKRPYSEPMLKLLDAADLDALVVHSAPGGTFSHYSSEHLNAASCTLELGKARPFGSNDLKQFAAIDRALRAAVSEGALPARAGAEIRVFRVMHSLIKHSEDFKLHLDDDTANFTELQPGMLLCEQPQEDYRVGKEGAWILFPNPSVALGLRAGMLLSEVSRSTLY